MNIWDRGHNEPVDAYKAFTVFLEQRGESTKKLGEVTSCSPDKIKIWKKKYSWYERAESYDRWKEEIAGEEVEAIIKAEAYKLRKDLFVNIQRLLVENSAYLEKLTKERGLETLKELDILELRDIANENLELMSKLIKPYKEVLVMLPEGKKLLDLGEDKGDKIIIIETPVTPEIVAKVKNEGIDSEDGDLEEIEEVKYIEDKTDE